MSSAAVQPIPVLLDRVAALPIVQVGAVAPATGSVNPAVPSEGSDTAGRRVGDLFNWGGAAGP